MSTVLLSGRGETRLCPPGRGLDGATIRRDLQPPTVGNASHIYMCPRQSIGEAGLVVQLRGRSLRQTRQVSSDMSGMRWLLAIRASQHRSISMLGVLTATLSASEYFLETFLAGEHRCYRQ